MKIFSNNANLTEGNSIITVDKIMKAKNSCADYISADLKLTKDNEYVCMPKSRILPPINTRTWTLEEIKAHRRYILSLQEFLKYLNGDKKVNLNIKCRNDETDRYADALLNRLNDTYDAEVMISSTNLEFLMTEQLNKLEVDKSLIINGVTAFLDYKKAELNGLNALFLSSDMFENGRYEYYAEMLESNQELYAWIWNLMYRDNPKIFNTILNTGICDGILTNEVNDLARRLNK